MLEKYLSKKCEVTVIASSTKYTTIYPKIIKGVIKTVENDYIEIETDKTIEIVVKKFVSCISIIK